MKKKSLPKIIFALALVPTLSFAAVGREEFRLDPGTGQVEFHAIGRPSALKIVGKGTAPRGSFVVDGTSVTGTAQFDLASLDTGIDMRTKHMKEKFLEVQKYPEAKLTLSRMSLPHVLADGESLPKVPFTGTLLLHGVERPVSGSAEIEKKGQEIRVNAGFNLRVADYRIDHPSFAGITMADEVDVVVQCKATDWAKK